MTCLICANECSLSFFFYLEGVEIDLCQSLFLLNGTRAKIPTSASTSVITNSFQFINNTL